MMLYTENLKDSNKKKMNSVSCEIQNHYTKKVTFLCTKYEWSENKIKKTITFTIAATRIKYLRNKCNQGGERSVHWKL